MTKPTEIFVPPREELFAAGRRMLSARRAVVTAHVSPDGDGIGSTLALARFLRDNGVAADVVFDDRLPQSFRFLPGYDEIINLCGAEKIAPPAPPADLLVILDTDTRRIGRVRKYAPDCPIINIDHHRTNDGLSDIIYSDYRAAATAELIYELIMEIGGKEALTPDIATCLYTSLCTDTGFFRFSNTRPTTHRAAAMLVEAGAVPNHISEAIEARPLATQLGYAKALETLELAADGKVAGLFIPHELNKTIESTEGFIDFVRAIDTVKIALLIKAVDVNFCRVSLRSVGLDVASLAAGFGGGGHWRAAGCTIHATLEEAKRRVLAAAVKLVNEELGVRV